MPISTIGSAGVGLNSLSASNLDTTTQYTGFKNRIINGAMVIDQRNAGASVTPTSGSYTLDRWKIYCSQASKFSVQQNAGSVTPPTGFTNYLGATSLSAYTVGAGEEFDICQFIEGYNIADLGFGSANAKTVTLSFWVRSSLTGTFGGALQNSGSSRSYVFSYTISSANTWEQKSITIAGDQSGTWLTTNGLGISCNFGIGQGSSVSNTAGSWYAGNYVNVTGATSVVGTSGATFYITGVQLEKGSTATSFDYRPTTTELTLCQRYYEKSFAQGTAPALNQSYQLTIGCNYLGANILIPTVQFKVIKRAAPTMTFYGVSNSGWRYYAGGWQNLSSFAGSAMDSYFSAEGSSTSGLSQYQSAIIGGNWTAEIEL